MNKKSFKGGFEALLNNDHQTEQNIAQNKQNKTESNKEIRATFIMDLNQHKKIKEIAYWERKSIKKILFEALENYFSLYKKSPNENENQKI